MSAAQQDFIMHFSEEEAASLSERGLAIYENKLKPVLEPLHDNEFISLHVETEDYALGTSSGDALRAIRRRHPQGWLVTLKIGGEPEWGLAARLLVRQMMTGQQK